MNYELRITNLSVIALLVVLCGTPFVSAQEWVRELFAVKEHDFGTVPRNAKAEYRFEITNPFEEEIHLSGVTTSCVCTTPVIETEVLKAHETGTVLVRFNTDKVSGSQKATINVSIKKPYPAIATLQVRGYVRGDITFEPASVHFGSVPVGEEREKTVKVVYHGTNAFWNIVSTESTNPHLSVEIGKTTPRRGRTEVELTLKLDKNALVGRLDEYVLLVSRDTTAGRIPMMIEGEVCAPVMVRPQEYSFGTVYEGDIIDKTILLTGDKPFLVKGFTISEKTAKNLVTMTLNNLFEKEPPPGDPLSENPPEMEPKIRYAFRLSFTAPGVTEPISLRETVVFETDNPDVTPTLTIMAVVKPK